MTRRSFHHEPEEVRRASLIAATLDAVADAGLAGATVREVASRASVTPGLIRRYFTSKDRLLEAAYAHFVNEITEHVENNVGEGSPEVRLLRLIQSCCSEPISSKRNIAIWTSFVGAAGDEPKMADVHRDGYRAFRRILEDIIHELWEQRGVELDKTTIRQQAIVANALVDGFWLEVALEKKTFVNMDVVTLAFESIMAVLQLPELPTSQHLEKSDT